MFRLILVALLSISLCACSSLRPTRFSPGVTAELQQGKRDFDAGYYQKAMRQLLPLACDGNQEAQYAVGYMYYYGFGVAQDTFVGGFWIERSAEQGYRPAIEAMKMIDKDTHH